MGVFAFVTAAVLIAGPPATISTVVTNPRPAAHAFDPGLRKTNELGCRDGEQRFCYALAGMLRLGIGGPADSRRAEGLFETACRKGYAKACSEVRR
jgi:TPR repeat protein